MSESGSSPPFDGDELLHVLTLLRQWTPVDVDELLDDVGEALDFLPVAQLEELAVGLNSYLDQLSNIALVDGQVRFAPYVVDLVETSQALRTSELVDQLTAHQSMKGVA